MEKQKKLSYSFWFKNIVRIITVVLCIYYFIKEQRGFIEGGVMFIASSILVDVLFKVLKIKISNSTDFIIQLFIVASLFLGKMYNVYSILPWWDSFVHFISGIFLGIGSLLIVKIQTKENIFKGLSPLFMATYALVFAIACAGAWEIWEFAGDQLFGLMSQGNSLVDTMTDICMGTGGGVIASIIIYFYFKKGKFRFIGNFIDDFSNINKNR